MKHHIFIFIALACACKPKEKTGENRESKPYPPAIPVQLTDAQKEDIHGPVKSVYSCYGYYEKEGDESSFRVVNTDNNYESHYAEFDKNGNITREILLDDSAQTWEYKNEFINGKKVKIKIYDANNINTKFVVYIDDPVKKTRTERFYDVKWKKPTTSHIILLDSLGRKKADLYYNYIWPKEKPPTKDSVLVSKNTYEYYDGSKPDWWRLRCYEYNRYNKIIGYHERTFRFETGKLEQLTYYNGSDTMKYMGHDTWTYSEKGLLAEAQGYGDLRKEKYKYVFDKHGSWVTRIRTWTGPNTEKSVKMYVRRKIVYYE